jgi:hypothetical protein
VCDAEKTTGVAEEKRKKVYPPAQQEADLCEHKKSSSNLKKNK